MTRMAIKLITVLPDVSFACSGDGGDTRLHECFGGLSMRIPFSTLLSAFSHMDSIHVHVYVYVCMYVCMCV